jgi:predicted transcriptional regulator
MWLDSIDNGGRGIVLPARGPLGRALRAARLDVLLSQQRLATYAGISQAAVSRLELGSPNWKLFAHLIDVLGGRPVVTVEQVLSPREIVARYMRGEQVPGIPDEPVDDWW